MNKFSGKPEKLVLCIYAFQKMEDMHWKCKVFDAEVHIELKDLINPSKR